MLGTLIILGYLFGEVAVAVGIGYLIYRFFLASWIKSHKMERMRIEISPTSIETLAKLRLVSNDANEIKSFITANSGILSNEMVDQLVAHLEELELKQRFTDLEASMPEEVQPAIQRKSE